MAKTKKSETMSVAKFKKQYNGAGLDTQELAEVASRVDGTVGEKAQALLEALAEFDAALEGIEFEAG